MNAAAGPSVLARPRPVSQGVALSRRFCRRSTLRGPPVVTLTGGSIGGCQNAHGQMLAGIPAVSGQVLRSVAVAVAYLLTLWGQATSPQVRARNMVAWLSAGTPGSAGVPAVICPSTAVSWGVGVPAARSAAAFQNWVSVGSVSLCSNNA